MAAPTAEDVAAWLAMPQAQGKPSGPEEVAVRKVQAEASKDFLKAVSERLGGEAAGWGPKKVGKTLDKMGRGGAAASAPKGGKSCKGGKGGGVAKAGAPADAWRTPSAAEKTLGAVAVTEALLQRFVGAIPEDAGVDKEALVSQVRADVLATMRSTINLAYSDGFSSRGAVVGCDSGRTM